MMRIALLALVAGCFSSRGGGESSSCPMDRSVEIGLQDDVKKLAGCTKVSGIIIRTGATIDVSPLAALEEMASESSDREIRKGFAQHRKETQAQIKRLEKVYKSLGQKPESGSCPGIEGLIKEKKAFKREKPSDELLEFYNIGAAQKVERYEITAYEGLIDMAEKLGMIGA